MKDNAVTNTRKYESTIRKSEDILQRARQAGNVQAEDIASRALAKAQEAKKMNEDNYYIANKELENVNRSIATAKNILGKRLGIEDGNKDRNKNEEKKQEVTLPPYFEEGVPPVNCAEGLKGLSNKNCYCMEPNRPPVCPKDGKRLKEEDKVYVFDWMIEVAGPGTHLGIYKSYDDAYAGCMEEAKDSSMDILDRISGTVVLDLKCIPEWWEK